ncbi:MAG: DUF2520 domain-containing protein [Chitinophagaceae bacterium]|nr:DUF2520 domain-containing protein [Chitinophagaceae bacterium]
MKSYKIVIIGSGNVGYQMAWHLHNAGHQIIQVFSRHLPSAKWIGNLMDIPCTDSYSEISQEADIYLVTVKDDAISDVAEQLKLNGQVIAHTSGSVPGSVLKNVSDNFGIFYPLQTLSRNVSVDFSTIPICVDASNAATLHILRDLGGTLTGKIIEVNDEQRFAIHVAAVFANNFTNHLFSISQMILEQSGLSFEIFKPLINETVRKIQNHDPLNVQTGPAVRRDNLTIENHLEYLKKDGRFAEIYKVLTADIQRWKPE